MGGNTTKRTGTYQYDKIFDRTLRRLQEEPNVSEEDKASITELVEHLLVKGISKQRSVKYINHLIVLARTAGYALRKLDRKGVEALVSRINAANYSARARSSIGLSFASVAICDIASTTSIPSITLPKTEYVESKLA